MKKKFNKFAKRYKDMIFSQAYYFTRNREDAADITQDVLIKLWSNMKNIKEQSVKSWLLRVTKNRCIDLFRSKKPTLPVEMINPEDGSILVREQTDKEQTPEQRAMNYDLRSLLEKAISELPPNIRVAIILREIHHMKYDEIANSLEIPINTLKVYLHRGRKLLFSSLQQYNFVR